MSTVTVRVNFTNKKLKQLTAGGVSPETKYELHNLLAKMCDPYVPFLNGPLSQTNVVSTRGVTYIQPYARYQYYGTDFNHTLDFHPLASAMWDQAMLRDRGKEFDTQVAEILVRRLNE